MSSPVKEKGADREWTVPPYKEHKGSAAGPVEDNGLDAEATMSCVLVGPPGSGKTSFVAALGRAGLLTHSDTIGCLPLGHASWLTVDASQALRRGDSLSSVSMSHKKFPFAISSRPTKSWPSNGNTGRLVIGDLDCGSLFSSEGLDGTGRTDGILRFDEIRDAEVLVLFVDSIAPRSDDWQVALLRFLDELLDPSRPQSGRGRAYEGPVAWPRVLPQSRVLVLLSRFDLFCEEVMAVAKKAEAGILLRGLTPLGLARRVDPLAQAIDLLGPRILSALLSAVGNEGQLAVGWVSSGGFLIDTGEPMLDAGGRPRSFTGAADLLESWEPLGHLEAAEWIVTGHHKGTIQPLTRSTLVEISREMMGLGRWETGEGSLGRAY